MMRITIFSDYYYPNLGGCEIYSRGLATTFAKQGHTVNIIAARHPYHLKENDLVDGLPIKRLRYPIPKLILKHLIAFPIFYPLTMYKLIQEFKKHKPDVVIQQYLASNTFYMLTLRKLHWLFGIPKFKWIISPQGTDIQNRIHEYRFHNWMVHQALKECDYLGGSSTYVLNEAIKLELKIKEKSKTILTAAPLHEFKKEPIDEYKMSKEYFEGDMAFIACVGRFVEKKGQDMLIQAFANLHKDYPLLTLFLLGFGPDKQKLEQMVRDLKLQAFIYIQDGTFREDVITTLGQATIGCLPSRLEVYGTSGVEVMAAGTPLVGSYVDGFPEVAGVKNKYDKTENAILTDPTPEGIEKGLRMVLSMTQQERIDMAKKAKEHVFNKYTYERACNEYLEVMLCLGGIEREVIENV